MPPKPRIPVLGELFSLTWLRGTKPRDRPRTKGLKRKCDTATRKFEKEYLGPYKFVTAMIRGAIKGGPGSSFWRSHITVNFKTAEDIKAGTHTPVHIAIKNPEDGPEDDFVIDFEKSEILPGGQPDKIYPDPVKAKAKAESGPSDADEDAPWLSDSDTELEPPKGKGVEGKGQADVRTEGPRGPKS